MYTTGVKPVRTQKALHCFHKQTRSDTECGEEDRQGENVTSSNKRMASYTVAADDITGNTCTV